MAGRAGADVRVRPAELISIVLARSAPAPSQSRIEPSEAHESSTLFAGSFTSSDVAAHVTTVAATPSAASLASTLPIASPERELCRCTLAPASAAAIVRPSGAKARLRNRSFVSVGVDLARFTMKRSFAAAFGRFSATFERGSSSFSTLMIRTNWLFARASAIGGSDFLRAIAASSCGGAPCGV